MCIVVLKKLFLFFSRQATWFFSHVRYSSDVGKTTVNGQANTGSSRVWSVTCRVHIKDRRDVISGESVIDMGLTDAAGNNVRRRRRRYSH